MLPARSETVVSHLATGRLLPSVIEKLGGLLVLLRLVCCGGATACTALLDAAEKNDEGCDDDDTDNRDDDANLRTVGKSLPAVADARGLLVLLQEIGFAAARSLVTATKSGVEAHTLRRH